MMSVFRRVVGGAGGLLLQVTAGVALAEGDSAPKDVATTEPAAFYSGSWQGLDVDKQWIINGLANRHLIRITCEGISNDQEFPSFLLVTEAGEYRWPLNESGAAFVDAKTLALREAGAGKVVECTWASVSDAATQRDTVQVDVLPGHNILLGGFATTREFSVAFHSTAGCSDLSAQLYIDDAPLVTADNQPQLLTPDASYFGAAQTVEAKINGLCPTGGIPILEFSLAR